VTEKKRVNKTGGRGINRTKQFQSTNIYALLLLNKVTCARAPSRRRKVAHHAYVVISHQVWQNELINIPILLKRKCDSQGGHILSIYQLTRLISRGKRAAMMSEIENKACVFLSSLIWPFSPQFTYICISSDLLVVGYCCEICF